MLAAFAAMSTAKKLLSVIGVVGALALLVWGINLGIHTLRQAGRDEVQAQWNAADKARDDVAAKLSADLVARLQPRFDALATTVGAISQKGAELNVTLPKAVAADQRYVLPACAPTPDVVQQLNAARILDQEAAK